MKHIVIILILLLVIASIYMYTKNEQYANDYQLLVPSKHMRSYNYNSPSCYTNRARPYVLSNNKSTADCVVLGLNTSTPDWKLPVTDSNNPAYYNEFPSHPFNYA